MGFVSRLRRRRSELLHDHPYVSFLIRSVFQPRRFQIYGVGAPKTGTHSIANIFSEFRSQHEPDYQQTTRMLERSWLGDIDRNKRACWLRNRDRLLWLECESSHLIAWFCDVLADEFPHAKFVLTVRDCYTWLNSWINQHISLEASPVGQRVRDLYHETDSTYDVPLLEELGVYTLDGYLTYWANHNAFVLESVPFDRLLVVPTQRISENVERIAQFVGASNKRIKKSNSHSFSAKIKKNILDEIDDKIITRKIKSNCQGVIDHLKEFETMIGYDLTGTSRIR